MSKINWWNGLLSSLQIMSFETFFLKIDSSFVFVLNTNLLIAFYWSRISPIDANSLIFAHVPSMEINFTLFIPISIPIIHIYLQEATALFGLTFALGIIQVNYHESHVANWSRPIHHLSSCSERGLRTYQPARQRVHAKCFAYAPKVDWNKCGRRTRGYLDKER